MLAIERQHEILTLLDSQGSIRVGKLAKRFEVTEETIRRDLHLLQDQGKLQRSHGGAVPVDLGSREIPHWQREAENVEEKRAIGKEAASRVEEGDTILLDASSTAWFMAQYLEDISVTVLTNAVQVAMALARHQNIRIIHTGGTLSRASLSFQGPIAERTLDEFHVDKLFLSCRGLDAARGLSDANDVHAVLKRKMVAIADRKILMLDHSKFGKRALTLIATLDAFDELITDTQADQAMLDGARELGLAVSVVDP
jgi:DeoR/GlpR family transcriptional regulator of sugar metabolism